MQEAHIQILNWEKFQFRKQIKNPSWFRVENRMWNDQQFFYFTAEERWVWVCLLSLASQRQSATLQVNLEWFCQNAQVGPKTIETALRKLKDNNCLEYTLHERNVNVTVCSSTRHNIKRHNKTEQDITKQDKTKQNIVCVEPKQVLVATPTVDKKDLSFFINQKLLELYPQEYLDREKVKMELWLATNGHKRPKSDRGMVRFVTSWLSRGWDQYRKGLQSNAPKKKTFEELLAEQEREKNGSSFLQTTDRKT